MEEKLYISLDHVGQMDGLDIVVLWKTGVLYSAQCGGIGCSHPEVEGFYLANVPEPLDMIDDCALGCCGLSNDLVLKKKAANIIDEYLKSDNVPYVDSFDYDNIGLFEEGIWPVKVTCEDGVFGTNIINMSAVLFVGNCD